MNYSQHGLARLIRAISDPNRAKILLLLAEGPNYPSIIAEELGLSKTNVSNHLSCLVGCGFLQTESQGRRVQYSLIDDSIGANLIDLTKHVSKLPATQCCCSCCTEAEAKKEA
ncbi:MAG: metalloregulator ArsR/SmtB family transcription factor [Corynebacterium sp.]|nr:metalloregulator ArsR/SmtB family transcription factor [Corynebacterium sp.]